jgi:GT2 family glycosyltransferase
MECVFAQINDGGFNYVVQPAGSGPLIAQARNLLVEKFLESACDYFLSVDTDIEWEPQQVYDLMAHDKDIVSGLYRSRGEKGVVWPVYLKYNEGIYERPVWAEVEDATELMSVASVGMGFCLIKRKVFEELQTSTLWPFAEILSPIGTYQGEDTTFCDRAKAKGFECFLDPTVRVNHSKLLSV